MYRRSGRVLSHGLLAMAIAVLPLAGCTSANIGKSAFGSNQLQVAEISNIGDYTAERALSEARAHFRNNDFGYSAALYKRAVELSPKDPEGYVGLGASYDRLRRFDLSDRVYASLHELSGGSVQYYNNVGYSHLLRGEMSEAMNNFRRAQKLAPDNVVVANNIRIVSRAAASRA